MGNCYNERIRDCFNNYEDMQSSTVRNNIATNITADMITHDEQCKDNTSKDVQLIISIENEQPNNSSNEMISNEIISNEMISNEMISNEMISNESIEKSIIIEEHFEQNIVTSPKNIEDEFEMIT